jgi:hypothetical protein
MEALKGRFSFLTDPFLLRNAAGLFGPQHFLQIVHEENAKQVLQIIPAVALRLMPFPP